MIKSLPILLIFLITLASCSKSESDGVTPADNDEQLSEEGKEIKEIEDHFGFKFSDKTNLSLVDVHATSEDTEYITFNGVKANKPWTAILDKKAKSLLFEGLLKYDPDQIDLGYGKFKKVNESYIFSVLETDTHIYMLRAFRESKDDTAPVTSLLICNISTGKIAEGSEQDFAIGFGDLKRWHQSSVRVTCKNDRQIIYSSGNSKQYDGPFGFPYLAASTTDGYYFEESSKSFIFINLLNKKTYSIGYSDLLGDSDRVKEFSITTNEGIIDIKITAVKFNGETYEKLVKVDKNLGKRI